MTAIMAQQKEISAGEEICALVRGRRRFLRDLMILSAGMTMPFMARRAFAFRRMQGAGNAAPGREFIFAQVRYEGGSWDPEPSAAASLLRELVSSTSVAAAPERIGLRLDAPDLFSYPFLYMAGTGDFDPFEEAEIRRLRKFLRAGGTLVGDDCTGTPGFGFDAAFRREMARVFPDTSLVRLSSGHTVFRSFFLVRGMGGRRIVSPFLEGINIGQRTPVLYSANGLFGAWARDARGSWVHPAEPGGERQRRLAFHLGVNLVMYALCADYKQDRIHLPFLRQKI
jgi:hypothetical protein